MKSKIFILSGLLCTVFAYPTFASDCLWDDCEIGPMTTTTTEKPTPLPEYGLDTIEYPTIEYPAVECVDCYWEMPGTQNVNIVSVKPVEPDDRAPVWDGSKRNYKQPKFTKTVDGRDGVPIWDDSISSYKDKNFHDYFLQPEAIVYLDTPNYMTRTEVNQAVEDLLIPYRPTTEMWINGTRNQTEDLTTIVEKTFDTSIFEPVKSEPIVFSYSGCPFETDTECDIWRKKPIVRETVSPRSPKIHTDKMDVLIYAATIRPEMDATEPVAAPLLERYKMLMRSANACCTDGMAHQLKSAGASDGLVYKFMSDDANFYGIGARCLMMTDADFDRDFPNTATAAVAADVRNGCLCRSRQQFTAMLAPFAEVYASAPEFKESAFNYTYTDGLQRMATVSINQDVKNVLDQLARCP